MKHHASGATASVGRSRRLPAAQVTGGNRHGWRGGAGKGAGRLDVAVVDAQGRPARAGGLQRWLSALVSGRIRGSVTVALVSDARVRALNRTFRGHDRVTDVLSFPAEPASGPVDPGLQTGRYLGDIAIAEGVARRQAQQLGHGWATELRILALHGLLHLIGYDHEAPSDDGAMARTERTWRKKGNLPDGLIDRTLTTAGDCVPQTGDVAQPRRRSGARSRHRPSRRAKSGAGTLE